MVPIDQVKTQYLTVRNALERGNCLFTKGDEPFLVMVSLNPFEDEATREKATRVIDASPEARSILELLDQTVDEGEEIRGLVVKVLARQMNMPMTMTTTPPPRSTNMHPLHLRIGRVGVPGAKPNTRPEHQAIIE